MAERVTGGACRSSAAKCQHVQSLPPQFSGPQAILDMTRALSNRAGNLEPGSVYPDYPAPIVRKASDGTRELAKARWGMPSPQFAVAGKSYERMAQLPVRRFSALTSVLGLKTDRRHQFEIVAFLPWPRGRIVWQIRQPRFSGIALVKRHIAFHDRLVRFRRSDLSGFRVKATNDFAVFNSPAVAGYGLSVALGAERNGTRCATNHETAAVLARTYGHPYKGVARIGYARVSTIDQDLDTQFAKLKAEGCEVIRSDKVSGASREGRTELVIILAFLRPGDELVVTRRDRLGRDTRDVLNLIHECDQRGAFVTVLDPNVSTRNEMGQVNMTVLGMVAQIKRRFIKERQREGIERAKANGLYRGGKRRVDRDEVLRLHGEGLGPTAIAKAAGCTRMQVYQILD